MDEGRHSVRRKGADAAIARLTTNAPVSIDAALGILQEFEALSAETQMQLIRVIDRILGMNGQQQRALVDLLRAMHGPA
jgi:hypothetical protein